LEVSKYIGCVSFITLSVSIELMSNNLR